MRKRRKRRISWASFGKALRREKAAA